MNEESKNFNQQFKMEIRRRQIDEIFQKKRKEISSSMLNEQSDSILKKQESHLIEQSVEQKNMKLHIDNLKTIAKMSIDENGIKIFKPQAFVPPLFQFLKEEYLSSSEQYFATVALQNILCYNSANNVCCLNILPDLLLTAINGNIKIRENCMAILFEIIHDSSPNSISQMIESQDINIINFLHTQMQSQPSLPIISDTLKCFYYCIKKLNFPPVQNLIKMKRHIFFIIKNSINHKIIYTAALCLVGFLKCLPHEGISQKSGMLETLVEKIYSSQSQTFFELGLNIIKQCLKNLSVRQIHETIVPYLMSGIQTDKKNIAIPSHAIMAQLGMQNLSTVSYIVKQYPNFLSQCLDKFNQIEDPSYLNVMCNLLAIFLWEDRNQLPKSIRYRARQTLSSLLMHKDLDPHLRKAMESSLENNP